jgi:hypothetical protein
VRNLTLATTARISGFAPTITDFAPLTLAHRSKVERCAVPRDMALVGNNYAVIPTSELDDGSRAWLAEEGALLPDAIGRWPSSRELRAALDSLDNCTVEYRIDPSGDWDADVRSAAGDYDAVIWATGGASPDDPCEFTFHKPNEVFALCILERLSHICGPLVIIEASGMRAVVVTAGANPEDLHHTWYRDER